MHTRGELRRLASDAVRAGRLPGDAAVPFSSTIDMDVACSLCGEPLGLYPAFRLLGPQGAAVLHAGCFSAWIDVVVEPTMG